MRTALFTLSAATLLCGSALAQQANVNLDYRPQKNTEGLVPFSAPLNSPDVHDDRTVTFRLKAPAAKDVRLVGVADGEEPLAGRPASLAYPPHLSLIGEGGFDFSPWPRVRAWLDATAELEALSSLAGYAWEHPEDPFPEVLDLGPERRAVLRGEALRHPLLAGAVPNDLLLGGDGPRVLLVSGSNMSGKSTYLRTVGVNVVLALAGAPVRAARLALTPLHAGATLRIQDSLQASKSRFYAEITRLKALADLAEGGVPLLFLLDEILHGTNSHDRRIGAEAIVRGLVAKGAIGLVTTHDLALTELAGPGGPLANAHFEDQVRDGEIAFDYRLRPGVVQHSNAIALMRAIGLRV